MVEAQVEKQVPKTITVDVDAESYSSGYEDASKGCHTYTPPNLYLGHAQQYWTDVAINWGPLIIILFIYVVLIRRGSGKQNTMMQVQRNAFEELQNMNKLLAQISEKLDKK